MKTSWLEGAREQSLCEEHRGHRGRNPFLLSPLVQAMENHPDFPCGRLGNLQGLTEAEEATRGRGHSPMPW